MALAILGVPLGKLSPELVRDILKGGAQVCEGAGIPVAGGHSIDSPEPIYGLAVIGTCAPRHVRRNTGAKPDDVLILTKPIGVGIYSSALKSNALSQSGYSEMIATTTQLNKVGADLARHECVHAITDVTGFGLLGHSLEMGQGAGLQLVVRANDVPLLSQAAKLAQQGFITGASQRNWSSYGNDVELPPEMPEWRRHVLTDPQTSGGLLLAVARESGESTLSIVRDSGCAFATIVGYAKAGSPTIRVEP
jgi:selenide,water dikinase